MPSATVGGISFSTAGTAEKYGYPIIQGGITMKFSKRILAAAAALCMAAAMTACGGSSDGGDTVTTTKAPETTASTAAKTETTTEKTTTSATTTTEAPLPQAPAGAITFDTASLYTAHAGTDSGAAKLNLDIVDLDGDKKLRVQVLDKNDKGEYNIPKVIFDLPELLGQENVHNIGKIAADMTCVARDVWINDDGSESLVVGNFLGTFGSTLCKEDRKDADGNLIQKGWAQVDFSFQDWENPTHSWHHESEFPIKKLPVNNYCEDGEGTNLLIMRWGQKNQVDFYIDNLTFYDKEGKVMEIKYDAAGNSVDVKQDTMKTEAPAQDSKPAESAEATTTKAE